MLKIEPVSMGVVAYPEPYYVPLPHVPYSLGSIYVVMQLTFYNRLEVRLHLAAGNVHYYSKGKCSALFNYLPCLVCEADNLDLSVFYLIHFLRSYQFKGRRLVASSLDEGVLLPDPFTLKGLAEGDRDRGLLHCKLDAPHFYTGLYELVLIQFLNNVLVCANTARPYLRHICVAYGREAHVYGAGACRPLEVIHWAKGKGERKYPVLVVLQDLLEVTALNTSKGQG